MNRTQLSQLAVLAAVARHGSFRAAATELGIAPSAVTHAISALESSVGLRLMARTTRSVAPTEEGRRLLDVLGPALGDIEAALTALSDGRDKPAGPLRITMPLLAARDLIAPRLGEFVRLYPDIELEIVTDDRFEDIVEKGFDAGLRLGEHLEADMVAVRVSGSWRGAVVGAPGYFESHPKPIHPRDLASHICIRRRFSSGTLYRWEFEKDGRAIAVDVRGGLILSDQSLMRQAALDGAGLAYVFDARIEADIEGERLVRVLDDWCPPFDGFSIYYPSRRQMRPALRAFIDFFRWRG
ncbi:LysR family transcriptional regulator [Rhizobium wuzhouense]|uniref:LysR family transcriptional regulator n=1 Tax=Rhizobium wuzhouense TaxID=1986026 RepID=A0ABX5NXC8_9HYPH|nr:LysR family transcriptional regulator [Rhizobium wuzhouense]PYB77852.1 LysR family transcriptional regulator [Rhizobium wuzhouense]